MASSAIKSREPILGYEITERIGAGGYGEVWKATAPGGLYKAIKFVYGYLDDERAKRELKALARVKQVRHPFLLSLERIEIVDGQLVIVTELADLSLKDRHEQCKAGGMIGIPREELLGYLRDAADALDYMREKYSLQHLDVKPENLLILGGHVKVADFGLVKDIEDTRASMMGGLTPIYASPEVFDDRPSQCSDQYSLAIVYQEMLTDTLPFPGRTTAQLAAQHLQSRARLTALPPCDKSIIDRALTKAPQERFPDCRAMVDALIAAGRPQTGRPAPTSTPGDTAPLAACDTHPVRAPANRSDANGPSTTRTQTLDECRSHSGAPPAAVPSAPRARPAAVLRDLPPLAVNAESYLRPALFVGIGGTAIQVLGRLRARLVDHFGSLERLSSIRLLAIDTDAESLAEATQADNEERLCARETLAIPLRKTEDYRQGSTKLLAWMSRRWLYNIPRSLQTEGLRPLGRLALVDHAESLMAQLKTALDAISASPAAKSTAEEPKEFFKDAAPRVCLLASISGGTGGGMVLDVAYALKKMLAQRGYPEQALSVLLLHSSGRNPSAHDLAVANSYATLGELAQYLEKGYSGEPACGLAPLSPLEARLPATYLLPLGDELNERDLAAATESIADYLHLATATPAANWLDAAREDGSEDAASTEGRVEPLVRTFGVCRLGSSRDLVSGTADQLCLLLLERWSGERRARRTAAAEGMADGAAEPAGGGVWSNAEIERLAQERIAAMGLSVNDAILALRNIAQKAWGGDVDAYLGDEVDRLLAAPPAPAPESDAVGSPGHPLLEYINRLVGLAAGAPSDDQEKAAVALAFAAYVKDDARQKAAELRSWAAALTDRPNARLKGAIRALECVAKHARQMRDSAQSMRARTAEELRAVTAALARPKPRTRGWPGVGAAGHASVDLKFQLVQYAAVKFLEASLASVGMFAQQLTWELATVIEELKEAQRELAQLAQVFSVDQRGHRATSHPASEPAAAIASAISETVKRQTPELLARLDAHFQSELAAAHGGICAAAAKGAEFCLEFERSLRVQARKLVCQAMRDAGVGQKILDQDADAAGNHALLRSCLAEANPGLAGCGGARRLLVVTGDQQDAESLAHAVRDITSHDPSVLVDSSSEPVLCYEVAAVPLANAAAALVENQPHCAALAARLHTRCDISWTAIVGA